MTYLVFVTLCAQLTPDVLAIAKFLVVNRKYTNWFKRFTVASNHHQNKKLNCRRETARRFVSLNILLNHSTLKAIRIDTVE